MAFLTDGEIGDLLKPTQVPPLATEVDPTNIANATSQIQAASLDLTIGAIYLPGSGQSGHGSSQWPLVDYCLGTGETAVIKTKEVLCLPPDLAGIAFPPANLSLKGLLTTNPGHIDPGYSGPLHLTVINMSREAFALRAGDRIMRVLFARLSGESQTPYNIRYQGSTRSVITRELLERLSRDFVNVTERATSISNEAVKRAQLWATVIPVIVALITVIGALVANRLDNGKLGGFNDRLSKVESTLDVQRLDQRVTALEAAARSKDSIVPTGKLQ